MSLRVDGERLELGSLKERAVLAALALDVGRPVALHALLARLWDGDPPPHARENAHTYISRLRGRLRRAGTTPHSPQITSRAHTYTLEADPDTVDWHRYQRLVGVAAATAEDGHAAELFRQADRLWEGEALSAIPGLWAETARRTLAERRLAATVARTAVDLRLGRFRELVAELTALTAQHPDDETLLGHLTLAYYGCGRYTEALRVYEKARRMLMAEYGARPGPALQRIHLGVLNHVQVADLVRTAAAPPVPQRPATPVRATRIARPEPARERAPRNLPSQPPLIGRHEELRRLTDSFATAANGPVIALESVSGMGGVGKTAVAIHTAAQLAERYPDSQLYLDLRAHSALQEPLSPAEALTALLRALGTPSDGIPVELDELAELWRSMLARRRAVIVLDDVVDANQVRPLLPHDTSSLVLLTSRRHITGLPTARHVQLDVLPQPDAIALFRRFAGEERTRDLAAVGRVVDLLGRLPLGLELIASRFQAHGLWTLGTLQDRLTRPGRLNEIHDTDDRDLTRIFELTYRTLTKTQRQAFRRLSLHPGPDITVPVAAAVLNVTPDAAERIVENLLANHLLREPAPERLNFHDLLSEFARHLAATEDGDDLRDQIALRLITFYVQAVDRADRTAFPRRLRDLGGPANYPAGIPTWADAPAAKAWLTSERENILAVERFAVAQGHPDLAARLAFNVAGFLNAECYWQHTVDVLQRAVARWSGHGPHLDLCSALLDLSDALANTGQYEGAADAGRRALDLARTTGDPSAEAEALRTVGALQWHRGEHAAALDHFQQAFALKEGTDDTWSLARLHNNIGVTFLFLGENESAIGHFREARRGFSETGDERRAAGALVNIGNWEWRTGRFGDARAAFEEAIILLDGSGNRHEQAIAQISLAEVLTELGDSEKALELCRSGLEVFHSLADKKGQAETLITMGVAAGRRGGHAEAVDCLTEALQLAQDIGAAHQVAKALRGLGRVEYDAGRLDAAAEHASAAVSTATRIRDLDEVVESQMLLAEVHHASGAARTAYALLQQTFEVAHARGHRETAAIRRRLTEVKHGLTD
ncbi:AfsR/SARP family transcriptional regulator [Actinacidiphila bryophytorum]|uniref:AfsR/SARP family transcriptional regulator n=1 Tax=Actinacidiphila bryophytorum TaxID=1436133 RepID=UPI002176C9E6|nr:tetratricopeptide repeat protein [Actinacidiphila bryophytorum]UWE07670.1 tetratricopeptide repeat protein [Actinacidiphila bryophytorum]